MAKFPTMEEFAKQAVDLALDEFQYEGKTIREWTNMILSGKIVEVVRCDDCKYAKPYDRGDGRTGYYCQHPNSTFLYGANWERIFEPVRESNDFCSHGKKNEA